MGRRHRAAAIGSESVALATPARASVLVVTAIAAGVRRPTVRADHDRSVHETIGRETIGRGVTIVAVLVATTAVATTVATTAPHR